jgi:hypothetical protein
MLGQSWVLLQVLRPLWGDRTPRWAGGGPRDVPHTASLILPLPSLMTTGRSDVEPAGVFLSGYGDGEGERVGWADRLRV